MRFLHQGSARRLGVVAAAAVLSAGGLTACGGGGDSNDDFCKAVQDAEANNPDPSASQFADAFGDLADKAPSDIKDDMDLLADAFADPTTANSDDVTTAFNHLATWTKENCSGFELGQLGG